MGHGLYAVSGAECEMGSKPELSREMNEKGGDQPLEDWRGAQSECGVLARMGHGWDRMGWVWELESRRWDGYWLGEVQFTWTAMGKEMCSRGG